MEYDLHVHSRFSFDCRSDPKRIVATALKKGLRGIAVTDHDSVEGALAVRELAGPELLVAVGMEAATEGGDLVGLFLSEPVLTKNPFEFIDGVRRQGGVVYLPHPFRYHLSPDEKVLEELDGIEGYNGRSSHLREVDPTHGEPRVKELAERYDLFVLAGSDAHRCREIGRGRTVVPANTLEDLRREILRGNTLLCGPRRSALGVAAREISEQLFRGARGLLARIRTQGTEGGLPKGEEEA